MAQVARGSGGDLRAPSDRVQTQCIGCGEGGQGAGQGDGEEDGQGGGREGGARGWEGETGRVWVRAVRGHRGRAGMTLHRALPPTSQPQPPCLEPGHRLGPVDAGVHHAGVRWGCVHMAHTGGGARCVLRCRYRRDMVLTLRLARPSWMPLSGCVCDVSTEVAQGGGARQTVTTDPCPGQACGPHRRHFQLGHRPAPPAPPPRPRLERMWPPQGPRCE